MDNNRRPPYLDGGTPGALVFFKIVEGVLAGISLLGLVVNLFVARGNFFIMLISSALSGFGLVLTIIEAAGARALRKGDAAGAERMRSVWNVRRVLIIILLVILGIYSLILMFSARSGFLAGLIVLLIDGGMFFFLLRYASNIRANLEVVSGEMFAGKPADYVPKNRLSGMAITLGVLLAVTVLIMMFNARSMLPYSSVLYEFNTLIALVLFLSAGRLCLVAGCNRAFKRAHANRTGEGYGPTGMNPAPALSILGAMLLSWSVLFEVRQCVTLLSYRSHLDAMVYVEYIASTCGFALLAMALLHKKRDLLAAIGTGILTAIGIYSSRNLLSLLGSESRNIPGAITSAAGLLALVLVLALAVMALARRNPAAGLRSAAVALAGISMVAALVNTFVLFGSSAFEALMRNFLPVSVPQKVGLIAVALAVGRAPATPEVPEAPIGTPAEPAVGPQA